MILKTEGLDSRVRSLLFAQLAQAERAGLPVSGAVSILRDKAGKMVHSQLSQFSSEIKAGTDLAKAGLNSGLFLPWESRLLRAAEVSGKLATCYSRLSRRYANRASHRSKLKAGLALPVALFVLVLLLAPLKALYFGEISASVYLVRTTGSLLLFFGGLYLLFASWTQLETSGSDNSLHRLILRIPLAGGLIRKQQQRDFLDSLGMLLDSGVPALEALSIAAKSISHPRLRNEFANSADYCRDGMSVTTALKTSGALPNQDVENLLQSGEFSGRLEEMIQHTVLQLDEQLDATYKAIADWLPKVIYLLGILLLLL